jgi:transposase
MVTDKQVRRMMKMVETGKTKEVASLQTGMDRKTARKYLKLGRLPSEVEKEHTWRTRTDPFEKVWDEVLEKLEPFPRLEAKTLFEFLQQEYPGRFADGQLRTLQRRVKVWRALEGPGKEVFFPQEHHPGVLSESDYTRMGKLGITIQRQPFDHMVYHFVLTYSNWETGNVCFSESYESLSAGLQNALWKLGGVPKTHRTDSLSSAVNNLNEKEAFTQRYKGLLKHYGLKGQKTQAGKGNENGDVEQRHHRLKRALDQALLLRGSRDFESRGDYEKFLKEMFAQLNKGRQDRFGEELRVLKALPAMRLEDCKKLQVSVGPSSTIRVLHNRYSVHSRLIGEKVQVRAYAEWLDIWYGQRRVDRLPRLQGKENHRIDYRHIIDWLVRKPGAFANYRYRDDLFPTSRFRIAYDILKDESPARADREYLKILHLAAKESESAVDRTLGMLIDSESPIRAAEIRNLVCQAQQPEQVKDPIIVEINLQIYDSLFEEMGVVHE